MRKPELGKYYFVDPSAGYIKTKMEITTCFSKFFLTISANVI